ncbi:MAG: aldo/keto reductase [Gemmatimonadetes bacterium]|nr:aldo/keto reductase [Gemmatimonadota bacterium]NIR78177.1 aldo/keto reductase [Gemmatimonadota bacterium]NIT86747.1 aldo/keto reductase [Gemmatimonadota bacterium]NIU30608.1 aldo/keto reductase [Gemmatimonadota bacterium]NIU35423.1 aldo/keto reductase [Gemmatimonadota bacterium]
MTDPEPELPPVIVGTWQLSAGHRSEPRSRSELLGEFVRLTELGLTTFDCADIYTGVEEFLGDLRARVRKERGEAAAGRLRFHTKFVPDYDVLETLTRDDAARIVDRSRARLGVEALDLVQFAWWDYEVDRWVEVAGWLDELREEGKIAELGATNFDAPSLQAILDAGIPIRTHQVQYSALDHRPEGEMTALCREQGVALICYGVLAGGFLSDRWLGASPPDDPSNRSLVKYRLIIEEYGGWKRYQALLRELRRIGDAVGASIAQVAAAYALSRPGVASILVGASRPERMAEAARAAELELPESDRDRIRSLAGAGPEGPVFGLEREKEGPHGRIMKYNLNREG